MTGEVTGNPRGPCCRGRLVLVGAQTLLGVTATALAVYLYLYVPATRLRDAPFWASAPLCAAGLVGIYYCATDFHMYAGTTRAFVMKTICLVMSSSAAFLCLIATVFPAIHLGRIITYHACEQKKNDCHCFNSPDPNSRIIVYERLTSCDLVYSEIQICLIVSGTLSFFGSLVSLWFLLLVWKARYGKIYSGLGASATADKTEEQLSQS